MNMKKCLNKLMSKKVLKNQNGIVHLIPLIILVIAGVVGFIVISSSAGFKNQLFSKLFPKQASFAEACTGSSKNFEVTLRGDQEAPPVTTTAAASVYMYLDASDNTKLNFSLSATVLPVSQVTAMHVHSPAL